MIKFNYPIGNTLLELNHALIEPLMLVSAILLFPILSGVFVVVLKDMEFFVEKAIETLDKLE